MNNSIPHIKNVMLLLGLLLMTTACGPSIEINKIKSTVKSVESGNTIVLANGLTVRLIGIKNGQSAKNYLENNLKGKNISLKANMKDKRYISSYKTKIFAYVNAGRLAVNGEMLKKGFAKIDFDHLVDSLETFKSYMPRDLMEPELSFEELFLKFAPATFSIATETGTGTGFFINSDGLAISNAHVLSSEENLSTARIYLWDADGKVEEHRYRKVSRILKERLEGGVGHDDWVIFYVQKEKNDKFAYYNLNRDRVRQGQIIAVLGTPLGKTGNFTEGTISNVEDDLISISADVNYGNSGGPVINKRGNVIGIASWASNQAAETIRGKKDSSKHNWAFSILPVIKELDKMGDVSYGGKRAN